MTELLSFEINPRPGKLRVEDYLALDALGAFENHPKTELIEGEIVFVNAQHRPHLRLKMKLYHALLDALHSADLDLAPFVEGSVAMPPHNVPEPDIAVAGNLEGEGLVPLEAVFLVVEVADSSLANDLGVKASIYARHRVPEYWVVDVKTKRLHQHWSPIDGGYAERRIMDAGETIKSATLPGLSLIVPVT